MTNHKPKVWIDTEFHSSHKKNMGVICVSMKADHLEPYTYWVHDEKSNDYGRLKNSIETLKEMDATFYAYLASAECRALESLGIDCMNLNWVCLYSEYKQLKMNNHKRMYGRYLRKASIDHAAGGLVYGKHGYSTPPSMIKEENEGRDNTEVGNGYADVVYNLLGIKVDGKQKDDMRDICIRGDYDEIEANREEISRYCESDIAHLSGISEVMKKEICENFRLTPEEYDAIALDRGRFAGPCTARIERTGIPFDLSAAQNLSKNVEDARDSLLTAYEEQVEYPFYSRQKRTLKDFKGIYVSKYGLFEEYVNGHLNASEWPLTDSGRLSQDNNDLKEYDGDPNIGPYRQVKKALQGLQSFDPSGASAKKGFVMDSVDPADNRLRVLFGIFGTMTGRNAPKARRFPFAMGRWARSLIKPPKGWSVGSIDYGSQEFMVAASMSQDPNMLKAYESGDPYLYFAQAAGAVPWDGTAKDYPEERKLFKATTLGLQYGMGKTKLARKLTIDCGREVTEREAGKLIQLHRKVYRVYWKWAEHITRTYKRESCIVLADGWGLNANCDRETSVRNFPVQGTSAVILRRALVLAVEMDVPVISPLHDAIYFCCPDKEFEKQMANLSYAMSQAVYEVLGDGVEIRQDEERHDHDHVWIEPGAEPVYNALAPFMQPFESPTKKRCKFVKQLLDLP